MDSEAHLQEMQEVHCCGVSFWRLTAEEIVGLAVAAEQEDVILPKHAVWDKKWGNM